MIGAETRKGVYLHEMGDSLRIGAQVDPPPIAAAETAPGGQRRFRCCPCHRVRGEAVLDSPVPILLVRVRIDLLFRLFREMNLHHRGSKCLRTGPDDPDGELPARQEGLDEDGLPENRQQFAADAIESRLVYDLRGSGDPLPVPSATGLAKSGKGSATAAISSGVSTTAKSGVGMPKSRITRFVSPLCSVSESTSGSEKVYGISQASSRAGTCASRPNPGALRRC